MARSGALNPASMPFFPGGLRSSEDEGGIGLGFGHNIIREHDRMSFASTSISSSEFLSVRSSPSPPRADRNSERSAQFQPSPTLGEESRHSPTFRQVDAKKTHSAIDACVMREVSTLGSLDTLPEADDTQTPSANEVQATTDGKSFFSSATSQGREHLETPPFTVNSNDTSRSSSTNANGPPTSSSPVSSLDSGSQLTANTEQSLSFEAQLKASPFIHDILDRLVRCEYSSREIQRDLGEVHRKVNLLVERSLGVSSQPEFKDPFAPSSQTLTNSPLFSPRTSIAGGIAPNQHAPSDDITQISQRLNTLTSSVGKLLAMQTQHQHHVQTATSGPTGAQIHVPGPQPQHTDIAPNQLISPNQSMLGHGIPNRPDLRPSPRAPNPPMRTWSVGALDLPTRPQDTPGRQLGDKRRSVANVMRRDSSGVLDPPGDNWANGSARESGAIVSKWEQLSLAPDLLRSLGKFGVGPPNKIQQRALPFLLRGSDIIAQAPPTQERIAAYVIPAIQVAVNNMIGRPPNRGPIVIMVSTTVDQATQAQRMIRDLGGPIGVRSALGVGASSANNDLTQELRLLQQNMPHIICGTPQKLHALFTSQGGLVGSEVRFLVLDEVDQLIARNLHEFVFNIVKLLPPPRSRSLGANTPNATGGSISQSSFNSLDSSGTPPLASPFPNTVRRFSGLSPPPNQMDAGNQPVERQTALFSNTVPQDVLNLASAIQLREPVRVLVRRDGNVTHSDTNQGSRGLRQFYLYLAFTAGRSDPMATIPGGGLGIIGSGRGASSAESAQAREWKLDALADLFDDVEVTQAVVHVGGMTALDSVVYKLASRGLEAVPLHGDMNAGTKLAALNKFRSSTSVIMRQSVTKVLVIYDVQVKTPEVAHIPLIINYDLPKAVEEYAHRVAPAIASNYSRAGVVINFVTATGGDVEMLRSIECFYKIKCPEVPMSLRDIV